MKSSRMQPGRNPGLALYRCRLVQCGVLLAGQTRETRAVFPVPRWAAGPGTRLTHNEVGSSPTKFHDVARSSAIFPPSLSIPLEYKPQEDRRT